MYLWFSVRYFFPLKNSEKILVLTHTHMDLQRKREKKTLKEVKIAWEILPDDKLRGFKRHCKGAVSGKFFSLLNVKKGEIEVYWSRIKKKERDFRMIVSQNPMFCNIICIWKKYSQWRVQWFLRESALKRRVYSPLKMETPMCDFCTSVLI